MSRRWMSGVVLLVCLLSVPGNVFAQSRATRPAFPQVQAPPPSGEQGPVTTPARPVDTPASPTTAPARPNVVERPWTTAADGPYARAQAVAAERVVPDTALLGASPYPDRYRSPVPAPFRYQPSSDWGGGVLFPGLPFPVIRYR
jgi:hypothetical protein